MKYLKYYKLFELHTDTYISALNNMKKSGQVNRAISFKNTYKEMTGYELDQNFNDIDYRNIIAIANTIGVDLNDIVVNKEYSEYDFEGYGNYIVMCDDEATKYVTDYIAESVSDFHTSFLMSYIDLSNVMDILDINATYTIENNPDDYENGIDDSEYEEETLVDIEDEEEAFEIHMGRDLHSYIEELQSDGNNSAIINLMTDFDIFVSDAMYHDGRGHFISPYDSIELSITIDDEVLYIYRVN